MLGSPRSTTTNILQRSIPSCVHISFKTLFICDFSIHPYIHICMHAHMHIYWWFEFFPKICINTKKIHTCVSCVFLMFSGIHIQKAEVLSVRFPKEYDHKHLAAKHPQLCTYFIQNSVYLWFFHTSIHTYMHAYTHAHLLMVWVFSKDMYKYKKCTYMRVSCVFFDVFWNSYSKSRGSKC